MISFISGVEKNSITSIFANFQLHSVQFEDTFPAPLIPTSKQHALKQHALADDLLSIVSGHVAKIPDDRPNHCSSKISLHDAVMSALAVMHLKYPSLLEFDEAKLKPEIAHNIRSLYNVKQIPCDTYMRELVDPVKPDDLRKIFTKLFAVVQGSNRLKHFKYLDEGYLAQGYNLEHNYGHGKQHLATNLAILMFLTFLIDQVEQLACPIFRAAWHHKRSKISLWLTIKSLFDWFLIDCWHSLLLAITQGGGQGQSIRSLITDTS